MEISPYKIVQSDRCIKGLVCGKWWYYRFLFYMHNFGVYDLLTLSLVDWTSATFKLQYVPSSERGCVCRWYSPYFGMCGLVQPSFRPGLTGLYDVYLPIKKWLLNADSGLLVIKQWLAPAYTQGAHHLDCNLYHNYYDSYLLWKYHTYLLNLPWKRPKIHRNTATHVTVKKAQHTSRKFSPGTGFVCCIGMDYTSGQHTRFLSQDENVCFRSWNHMHQRIKG